MTTTERGRRLCGFVPYPDSGAYGHWSCGRVRWHFGRHRFINYTIPRVPRFWRVRPLWRSFRTVRRLRRIDKPGYRTPYRFRSALYPSKYDPLPVRGFENGAVVYDELSADDRARKRRTKVVGRVLVVLLYGTLALVAFLLVTHATAPSPGSPSHGPAISSTTAAYPR